MWGYWMFIFHVAVSITLLLLLPFTKFAHAIYRIVALYIHALKPVGNREAASGLTVKKQINCRVICGEKINLSKGA
jgi:hypothetical protein